MNRDFQAKFIKASADFDPLYKGDVSAPLFRKKFCVSNLQNATLKICCLGYGYCYINGEKVAEDLFTAPVSDYDKLVWYHTYDVTNLLKKGENVIAVILGNGFFNENFVSVWRHNEAPYRDNPKFALELFVDGALILSTNDCFLCTKESFVTRNELRSGETFDGRLYEKAWKDLDFDDTVWTESVDDTSGFNPVRKECVCEPIREREIIEFVSCTETEKGYVLDFGKNFAGYLRVRINEEEGTIVKFSHSEEIYEDYSLKLNGLNVFYPDVDFQVDRYICGEEPLTWSPKFTYHGFRYVLVEGLTKAPTKEEIKAVFVCQDIEKNTTFSCSNSLLNKIYEAGINATYSNMHYVLTDCPTREKLGWTNDAQASAEQILIHFSAEKFLTKWMEDYKFAMLESGDFPSVIPSPGCELTKGPVSDGAFFEIPYRIYQYTGNSELLVGLLPYFEKYYRFFTERKYRDNLWLCDWDGFSNHDVDKDFIHAFYKVKLAKVILLAYSLLGKESTAFYNECIQQATAVLNTYLTQDGKSKLDSQTVISMLLYAGIGDKGILIEQLKAKMDSNDGHLDVGMLGIQYIYDALSENGCADYAYRAITATDGIGFKAWFDKGATTLWETWKDSGHTDSRNHHMYSNVLAWIWKNIVGIRVPVNGDAYKRVELKPCFIEDVSFARGSIKTPFGEICSSWERKDGEIIYQVAIPNGVTATYNGLLLQAGENQFVVES